MDAIAERRKGRRVPVIRDVSVELDSPKVTFQGKIFDLCARGAFINVVAGLPTGAVVDVAFDLPTKEVVRATASIRYVLPGLGMGVEFVEIGEEESLAIERFISSYLKT
ncbi:MAG TPA: PilZ domain-containing protein [Blastocatellia bacterium]|nr:PilZ domain-containing protein [Blastocatellia bacterium]